MQSTSKWIKRFLGLMLMVVVIFVSVQDVEAMMLKLSNAELHSEADLVIVGTVNRTASQWNSEQTNIYTTVEIAVAKVLEGKLTQKSIKVRVPGGKIDGMTETVTNTPVFQKGEEVLLFLNESTPENVVQNFASSPSYEVSGNFQGKLTISDNTVDGVLLKKLEDNPGLLNEIELNNKDTVSIKTKTHSTIVYSTAHDLFIDQGKRWAENATAITYMANGTPDQNNHIQQAAETWNSIEANFSLLYEGEIDHTNYVSYNGINEVIFYDMERADVLALAHVRSFGNRIVEADMAFNTNFNWSVLESSPLGHYDIQTVALHEFGHWLGLGDHYGIPELTMYYQYGGIKRDLHEGDIEGAIHNFGLADSAIDLNLLASNSAGIFYNTNYKWSNFDRITADAITYGDINSDGSKNLVISSPSTGIHYRENGNWIRFDSSPAAAFIFADLTDDGKENFVFSQRSGTWYLEDGEKILLDNKEAGAIAYGDMTGDGRNNLVISTTMGLRYLENSEWVNIISASADALTFADINGDGRNNFVASASIGTFYQETEQWVKLHRSSVKDMVYGDINGDGIDNLIVSHLSGVYYNESGGWFRLSRTSAEAICFANISEK